MRLSSLTRVRLLGLHPVTWLVGLVASWALVLIMVPGEMVELAYSHNPASWHKRKGAVYRSVSQKYPYWYDSETRVSTDVHVMIYEHGWPLPCYVRGIGIPVTRTSSGWCATGSLAAPLPPPAVTHHWLQKANWPSASDASAVDPLNYAIDLGVAMLLMALSIGGTERWLRKRGGLFRLRIIDLLVVITVVGAALGWWAYHGHTLQREGRVKQQMSESRRLRPVTFTSAYVGPEWLRRLCGNAKFSPRLSHVRAVQLTIGPSWREDMEQLTRLSYVEHVSFQGAIPTELLESLDSFPRLRSLTLSIAPAISSQQEGANIKKEDLVASRDLRKLRRLSLDVLHIHGLAIAVEDLDRLLAEVEPRELLLVRSKLDENAIRGLRKNHPGVHVMVYE